jgi:thioredoxin reductase
MKKYKADVVIIGAGAGGLAAAIEVKQADLSVLIIERDKELGGITMQCIHNGFGLKEFEEELTGPEYAQRFINRVIDLKIPYLLDTMVIEITKDKKSYAVNKKEGLIEVEAKAIILAMGCREKTRGAINIPGFRPTGIYTAGQAQRFVNIEGYLPGNTYVILGSGDIGMIMARRLTWEGCTVKAVVEIQPYVSGLLRNQVQCLEDYGIPLITSYTVTRIHVGLIPENELTLQAGAELSKNGGPIVDENLETTIEGIFACGNVLQVHDLVDLVTAEAKRAGKNAIEYINSKYGKELMKKEIIKCVPGENVNYVKPDIINKRNLSEEIIFTFRVRHPDRRVLIQFKDENNSIIYKRKKIYVIPSEMLELNINLEESGINPDCKSITIEVIPRPEVLIEED